MPVNELDVTELEVAVITSRTAPFPTLRFPQYLDYDAVFRSLASKCKVHLIGNILQPRPYASSQSSFDRILKTIPLAWNNPLAILFSVSQPIEKLRDSLDLISDSMFAKFCTSCLVDKDIDLLYSFPLRFDRYALILRNRLSKPLVVELWEDYACFTYEVMAAMGLPKFAILKDVKRTYKWMRDVAMRADKVIVPTEIFANRLHEFGIEKKKIHTVPVCVEQTITCSGAESIRKKYNLNKDEIILFHIGLLSPWHDLYTLINALRYVKPKIVLIIAGRKDEALERYVQKNIRNKIKIILTGKLKPKEVGSYISSADICVAPYRFHYPSGFFPAKVVRFMLAEKAIVATDLPEIREMFRGKEAGILVPQRNAEAIAEAIDYLAENDNIRLNLGLRAKEIAENYYTLRYHTEQLIKIYREAL